MSTLTEKLGLHEFDLSNSTVNKIIRNLGIETIPDLASRFVIDGKFRKMKDKGIGKITLTEISRKLFELGYISDIYSIPNHKENPSRIKFPSTDSKLTWRNLFDLSEQLDFDLTTPIKEMKWSKQEKMLIVEPCNKRYPMACWQLVFFFLRIDSKGKYFMVKKEEIYPFSDPNFNQIVNFMRGQFSDWGIKIKPVGQ